MKNKKDNKKEKLSSRLGLTISLTLFLFAVIIAALLIIGTVFLALYRLGLLNTFIARTIDAREPAAKIVHGIPFLGGLLQIFMLSTLLALALSWFFGRLALNPLRKVIDATRRVAAGDFSVRVQLKGVGELQDLSRSFNKMAHELSSIETLRSDFVNDFSHEFKTPIVSVQGFAELLQDGGLSEAEQREYIAIIIAESRRLAALSTNILSLSKYENMEIVAEKTNLALDEQIRRVISLTEPKWAEKGISLQVELEEDVRFEGNEDLMQQIWLNLLDNAIKFSPQGSAIQIGLTREGNRIRFTIHDEGPGMDEATQAHIFDKFFQGDASRAAAGNGLGLAIVKRIAELHGGTVEVRSEPGQGSTFSVIL